MGLIGLHAPLAGTVTFHAALTGLVWTLVVWTWCKDLDRRRGGSLARSRAARRRRLSQLVSPAMPFRRSESDTRK